MTAQIHERIILNGEQVSMTSCPRPPLDNPRITSCSEEEMLAGRGVVFSTACWRKYLGTWEICGGRLNLVGLDGIYTLEEGERLFADWFSGTLHVPHGDVLHHVHMELQTVYAQELLSTIEHGLVTASINVVNRDPVLLI